MYKLCFIAEERFLSKTFENLLARYLHLSLLTDRPLTISRVFAVALKPSQASNKFRGLWQIFGVKQFCASFTVIPGDFNARSKSWWSMKM